MNLLKGTQLGYKGLERYRPAMIEGKAGMGIATLTDGTKNVTFFSPVPYAPTGHWQLLYRKRICIGHQMPLQ
jgi:hypothetical protein